MNNSVTFEIRLKEAISHGVSKIVGSFRDLGEQVDGVNGHMSKFNSICSKLKFPDLSAQLDVISRYSSAIASLTDTGISFGQSIADLSSITGIVGEDLGSLTENARKFGKESGLGANTAARAYAILASQIQVSDIGMEGLNTLEKQSILLSEASGMAIDDAAQSMASTINQFGLKAEEANRIVNVLAAGSKYGAAEIMDLSESFKGVGSTASAMGLNVEQTTGALEALSKVGLTGSEAGVMLRNVLLRLNTVLGVNLRVTPLQDALTALEPELENTSKLTKIFGRESVTAAIGLIQNADAVGKLTAQVTGTNVAEEQAAIRTDTTAHKLEVLRAKVDDIEISIANGMGGFAALAAVVSENAVNVAALIQIFSTMTSALPKMVTLISALTRTTIAQKVASIAVKVATEAWATVQAVLNAVLSLNPIGIIIIAVTALVAAVVYAYNHFEGFRKVCDKVWAVVKRLASAVWDTLVKAFNDVTEAIRKAWEWLRDFLHLGEKDVQKTVKVKMERVDESSPDFIGPVAKSSDLQSDGVDKKKAKEIKDAMTAYAGLAKQLKDAADENDALGRSEKTFEDQMSIVEGLIKQMVPLFGKESAQVRDLAERYKALATAKVRAEGTKVLGSPLENVTAIPVQSASSIKKNGLVGGMKTVDQEIESAEAAMSRLNRLQGQLDLPGLSDQARQAIGSQVKALKEYLHVHDKVGDSLKDGWSSVKGIGNSVKSLTETLKGNGDAWDKICSIVDSVIGLFDGFDSVVKVIKKMTAATDAATAATAAKGVSELTTSGQTAVAAATTVGADAAVSAAERTKATASVTAAAGETMSAHASIPFVGIAIAAAMVGVMLAVMAGLPKFAQGGIAFGPTLGLFGEYSNARTNPEVVAPLDRLRRLVGAGGDNSGEVEFRISGRDLVGVLRRRSEIDRRG